MENTEHQRKLASIRKISSISPISDADFIELAKVDGWNCVIRKGDFEPGELIIYVEVDSWVPHEVAPFLTDKEQEPKEYKGVKGQKLKTVKKRGIYSQGLILPLSCLSFSPVEGQDVSSDLGITLFEEELPEEFKASFPSLIPRTTLERVQNLDEAEVKALLENLYSYVFTEKLDGFSMTVYVDDEKEGVCNRSLELTPSSKSFYWATAWKLDLINKIKNIYPGRKLALQGELVGPSVQKNRYRLEERDFYLFSVYSISEGYYLDVAEALDIARQLSINFVPLIEPPNINSLDELILFADGPSLLADRPREGLVIYYNTPDKKRKTYKVISNSFLVQN